MDEQVAAFQQEFVELLKKYEVGIFGTMYFRIGEEELVLDTTQGQDEEPDANTGD